MEAKDKKEISYTDIYSLWLPLAVMWIIMGIEQPAITSVIARLADAKVNLAAFGIAFSFVLIMESPILQLLTAATALSTDRQSYNRLFSFATSLGIGMTVVHLAFGVTPAFRLLLLHLLLEPRDDRRRDRGMPVGLLGLLVPDERQVLHEVKIAKHSTFGRSVT